MRPVCAFFLLLCISMLGCLPPLPKESLSTTYATQYTTTGDRQRLLQRTIIAFKAPLTDTADVHMVVDTTRRYQTIEGFGYTLTGGSAQLLYHLPPPQRRALLQQLLGMGVHGAGISYVRVSMGASDLDERVFSYNDLPAGQTDPTLQHFSLNRDTLALVPLLREMKAIRPDLHLLATPWSAPAWMKTNGSAIGGRLEPRWYAAYAQYFVRYLQAMRKYGLLPDAVTVQNEPAHGGNEPSMLMSSTEQADFIKNHLGPALQAAGLATKILIWDHNCDQPAFPLAILDDPDAKKWVAGTAFHLYAGEVNALGKVQAAHPDKGIYFTEQWTGAKGTFGGDLLWHTKNVLIGSLRQYSRVVLEWNLANDPTFGPHTPKGCTECLGALTVDGNRVSRNVSYYIIAQLAAFVPPGSVRVESTDHAAVPNVAFRTPAGKTVLLIMNEQAQPRSLNVQTGRGFLRVELPATSTSTLVW